MPLAAAIVAHARDDQAMAGNAEVVLAGHGVADVLQLLAAEFDELVANLAVQVIVLRVAVIVLVHRPAAERHLPQQSRLDQLVKSPVDGWPADSLPVVPVGQAGY